MQRKIKVLQVVSSVNWRGGEQQAAYLVEELKAQIEVIVLCSQNSHFEAFCKEKNITHFTVRKKKRSIDLTYARKIKEICKKHNVDLCHVHDAHSHSYALLATVIFGNKTPLILSRRVDFPIKQNWFSRYKYNHSIVAKILCVSDEIKRITAKDIRDQSKLVTVYSGIDLDKFQEPTGVLRKEFNIPQDSFLIGNTSALADHKDYFTFINAAKLVLSKEEKSYFIVIGDGPMRAAIKEYAREKDLGDRFIFAGFRNDITRVLGELDLFLITSKTEGLGTSILDAFACKVPVVATRAGGIPELVEHKKTGLLCAVGNEMEISEAVTQMREDISLRNAIVTSGFEKVKSFSKKNTAQQTFKQYEAALL